MVHVLITGEPTLEEQAELLIAALDMAIPPTPESRRISRRSIPDICHGTPSTEICPESE